MKRIIDAVVMCRSYGWLALEHDWTPDKPCGVGDSPFQACFALRDQLAAEYPDDEVMIRIDTDENAMAVL